MGSLVGEVPTSLAAMLDNSDWWVGGIEDENAIEEEMQLLREGGPGAVREKKLQESVQAWLIAKRNDQVSAVRLRRLADRAGNVL